MAPLISVALLVVILFALNTGNKNERLLINEKTLLSLFLYFAESETCSQSELDCDVARYLRFQFDNVGRFICCRL